ncbi:MAG: MFS transporter [Planctomycetes bacterium]|nr:MFS transporter [Planctomycetota bacterium]
MDQATVERSLDASIKDVAAYGIMVGLGETYLSACALHLGASNVVIGILGSVPLFVGACLQPLAANLVDRTGTRRRWYLSGAALQALTWVPILAALVLPSPLDLWVLIGSVILYFGGVHFASPPWNSTMGDLVPPEIRGRYFGRRTATMIVTTGLSTAVAGLALHFYKEGGQETLGFGLVFAAALVARILSVSYLARMADPPYHRTAEDAFTFWQFLRQLPRSNFAKFVFFVAALNFAAHVSGVYFIVYFLRELRFTYWEFMISQFVLVLSQIPALYFWGPVADRYGTRKVMVATGLGVALLPILFLASRSPVWVWFLQAWAGVFWSGFNLSASNFLLDAVSPPKRARCTAYFNLIVGIAILAAGMIGSAVVGRLPRHYSVAGFDFTLFSGFWMLLVVSFLLRVLALCFFLPRIREVRDVPRASVAEMLFRSTPIKSVAEAAVDLITNVWRRNGNGEKEP